MASLGGVLGGIAASPFRLAGGAAKMAARGAKAGVKGLALSAMEVSGALPIFAAAVGGVKAIQKGVKAGKNLLRPIGAPADGVTKDSAERAIAAAATETAKIDAETKKIEAETEALTGKKKTIAGTSMGGMDVEILEKIYGEVVSIRGLIGDKDPESEKKELKLDEQTRHKRFLAALAGLGFGGDDKKKKPKWDLGNLMGMIKGLVPAIIAGLGIAGLIKLWPKIASAFEGIADAISNINEFLDDMAAFFKPLTDFLGGIDPSTLGAGAGALKGTGSQSKRMAARRAAMKQARADSKKLKKAQDKARKDKARKAAKERLIKRKAAEKAARLKRISAAKAEKLRLKNQRTAQSQKRGQGSTRTTATRGLPGAKRGSGRRAGSVRTTQTRFATGGKKLTARGDPRLRRGGQALRTGTTATRFATGGRTLATRGDPRLRRGGQALRTGSTLTRFATGGRTLATRGDPRVRAGGQALRTGSTLTRFATGGRTLATRGDPTARRGGPAARTGSTLTRFATGGRTLATRGDPTARRGGPQLRTGTTLTRFATGGRAPIVDTGDPRARRGGPAARTGATLTRFATGGRTLAAAGPDRGGPGDMDAQRTARGGPGRWAAVSRLFKGGGQGALPKGVIRPTGTGGGRGQFVEKGGARLGALLDVDAGKGTTKPSRLPGWKAGLSAKPFVNPITQKPMSSRYYHDPKMGRWRDMLDSKRLVKGVTVTQYMKEMGFEFKPGERNFRLTAAQQAFMGERANFVNRMQGSMKWMGKAAGPLAVVFIGYAIKNAFDAWRADPETKATDDMWPFNDTTGADKRFKLDMAALAASFGVGWVAAILGGKLGFLVGGPIGAFFGGLAFGVGAGLAADKITRWLLGEEVDTREKERKGIKSTAQHSRDFYTGHVASKQADLDAAMAKEISPGKGLFKIGKHTQEEKFEDIRKAAIALVAAQTHAKSETAIIGERERTALGKLDVQDQEALQKMQKGTKPSAGNLLPGADLMPTDMSASQAVVGESPMKGRFDTGNLEGKKMFETVPDETGGALTQAGSNGGVPKADILVTNIISTTNSDQQTVSSTASTSNVITFDKAPSYSPMRNRYAV